MSEPKVTEKTYQLNSGYEIPAIGLGTWQSGPNEVQKAVEAALRIGYRHIDTAAAYGNEAEVGAGIKASGVPRNQIFLTTKLKESDLHRAAEALDESLEKLGTAYVDLYLVHWPCPIDPKDSKKPYVGWDIVKTWTEMQKLPETGKVRSIGVSNFGKNHLEQLFNAPDFKITPAVNQIEIHPCYPSRKILAYNTSKKIHSTAYSCLGSTDSPLYKNEALIKIAEKLGKTVQQVLLRWGLHRGYSVIPKSVTPARIQANFELDGWSLTVEEAAAIDAIEERFKVCDGTFLGEAFEGAALFQDDDYLGHELAERQIKAQL